METLEGGQVICQTDIMVWDKVNQETFLAKDPRTEQLFPWECGPAFSQVTGKLGSPVWSMEMAKRTSELVCLCPTVHRE